MRERDVSIYLKDMKSLRVYSLYFGSDPIKVPRICANSLSLDKNQGLLFC